MMDIAFFGSPDFVLPVITELGSVPDTNISAVVTANHSPVEQWAIKHSIPTLTTRTLKQKMKPPASELSIDIFIIAGYGKFLSQETVNLPRYGSLNIHPSLLPKLRGTSPVKTAVLNNDKTTGVTIMQMGQGMDDGPIIAQSRITIAEQDTASDLLPKLFTIGAKLLVHTLPLWENFITNHAANRSLPPTLLGTEETNIFLPPKPQNHHLATFTKKLTREDGQIDWSKPGNEIDRMARAFNPWPGIWTDIASLRSAQAQNSPVRARTRSEKRRVKIIKTHLDKTGKLIIDRLQIEGGNIISWEEFANGYLTQ